LPPGLELLVGWTGESMQTDAFVSRFAAAVRSRPPQALVSLRDTAEHAAAAAADGDTAGFLAAVATAADGLPRLGGEVGMPIVTPALARLVAVARDAGAAAKPSGAGGGDCGIAFATSPAQAEAIRTGWAAAGIVPVAVTITPVGVCHEPFP